MLRRRSSRVLTEWRTALRARRGRGGARARLIVTRLRSAGAIAVLPSGYGGADVGTSRSLATGEITELIESGIDTGEIVRRMVATGDWSEAGAVGFVSFLAHGPDAPARSVGVEHAGRRGDTA